MERAASVEAMRAFNRFYTRHVGLLGERHLDSALTLTEVRLLYELAHGDAASPTDLARSLSLDAGYVSRLLASLEGQGAVTRTKSPDDARRSVMALTAKGRKAITALESKTQERLSTLIDAVPDAARTRLVQSMREIENVLAPSPSSAPIVSLRDPMPGDIGWIIHRQAALYTEEYGWDWTYEGLIATICGNFVKDFDAENERCWVAESDGAIVGSVFLVRKSPKVAQLRLLYVEPSARGLGIGSRLVRACIDFARARGYRRMTLWTNDILVSARKIYQAEGFVLTKEEKHHSFGRDLVGQNWDLKL
jgi:DNA-binding MarR family transcriptional regulator/GNAT superfamily N-acetyltransferase